jgi:peptidoglycan/LPS O-acetylase OafA/YrhL
VTTETGRIDYLDGLRAVAIGLVLSLHWLSWYTPFLHGGSIGVDVFFVLSGFIITTVLWRSNDAGRLRDRWWSFLRRRVLRLYPALVGLVVISVGLYAVTPSAPLGAGEVALRGVPVLTQATSFWAAVQSGGLWLPALHPFAQTWSLAVEWYFYLLWPLVVFAARRRGLSARTVATASLGVAAVVYAASLAMTGFWFYFAPPARFAEILVGAALALWFQATGLPTRPLRFATPLALAGLAALGLYSLLAPSALSPLYRFVGVPVAVLASVVLIYTGYSNRGGPVHRLLSLSWLAAVGRCSYSLYLWHVVPMVLLEKSSLATPARGLIAVVLTVALTGLSYQFLERPFLRPRSDVLRPAAAPRAARARR